MIRATQSCSPLEDTLLSSPQCITDYLQSLEVFESLEVEFSDHILALSQVGNIKFLNHRRHTRLGFIRNSWLFISHFSHLSALVRGLKKRRTDKKLNTVFTFSLILTYPNSIYSPTVETNTPARESLPRHPPPKHNSKKQVLLMAIVHLIILFTATKIPFL